jgi:hypothetical protein
MESIASSLIHGLVQFFSTFFLTYHYILKILIICSFYYSNLTFYKVNNNCVTLSSIAKILKYNN